MENFENEKEKEDIVEEETDQKSDDKPVYEEELCDSLKKLSEQVLQMKQQMDVLLVRQICMKETSRQRQQL